MLTFRHWPFCLRLIRIPEDMAGKEIRCPACKALVRAPLLRANRLRSEIDAARPKAPAPAKAPERPTLSPCPACARLVSSAAASCPGCGHVLRATTIERTGKGLKAAMLVACVVACAGGAMRLADGTPGVASTAAMGVGILGLVSAMALRWWHHG